MLRLAHMRLRRCGPPGRACGHRDRREGQMIKTRPWTSASGSRVTPGRLLSASSRIPGDRATKRVDSEQDHEAISGQQAAELVGPGGALTDQPGAGIAERMTGLRVRRLDRRITVAAVLAISLAGCGQFYWGKSGSTGGNSSIATALSARSRRAGCQVGRWSKRCSKKPIVNACAIEGICVNRRAVPPPGWHRGIE